jgi:hypothetical protein
MSNARSNGLIGVGDRYNFIVNEETEEKIDRTHLTVLAVLMKLGLIFLSVVDALVCVVFIVKVSEACLGEE